MTEYAIELESAERRRWWAVGWQRALNVQVDNLAGIWPPWPWKKRQERNCERLAEYCKRRRAAARQRQEAHGDLEPTGVVRCSELLAPLVCWGEGLFGAALQNGAINTSPDIDGEWEELRVERTGDEWTVTYAPDEVQAWEVYRGQIPSREFWLALLRNSSCGGFGGVGGNGANNKLSDATHSL